MKKRISIAALFGMSFALATSALASTQAPGNGVVLTFQANPLPNTQVYQFQQPGFTFGSFPVSIIDPNQMFQQNQNPPGTGMMVVSTPNAAIPVPASLPLMLAGLAGFGFLARRRAR